MLKVGNNIMKRMLFLLPFLALCLNACTSEEKNTTDNTPAPTKQVMEKHEISLNLTNFLTYFDITSTTSYNQTTYVFSGCLSYAYYDNVVITIKYHLSNEDIESNSKIEEVVLNAAGNGHFDGGGKYLGKINAVKGKVTYWM